MTNFIEVSAGHGGGKSERLTDTVRRLNLTGDGAKRVVAHCIPGGPSWVELDGKWVGDLRTTSHPSATPVKMRRGFSPAIQVVQAEDDLIAGTRTLYLDEGGLYDEIVGPIPRTA